MLTCTYWDFTMEKLTRRGFLTGAVTAAALAGTVRAMPAAPTKKLATDWVPLGNSGVKVTRLAFGTGTHGGRVQRELGQEQFTRLVRHAYESGIRFFETADSYKEMPQMLAAALKGVPRDSYKLMTKYRTRPGDDVNATIDRYRKDLNSDYFDILLIHCVRTADWPEQFKPIRDAFSEAKAKKVLLAHGASCHGLLPLRRFPDTGWLDVALMRMNHDGTMMDNLKGDAVDKGDVGEVFTHVKKIHARGTGVIGMKLMGEGRFTSPEDRDASLKYVIKLGVADSMTIGFKTTAEIDEAIQRINAHLNA
jgi:predicted aldo/keto reductase-like oxidoreductase